MIRSNNFKNIKEAFDFLSDTIYFCYPLKYLKSYKIEDYINNFHEIVNIYVEDDGNVTIDDVGYWTGEYIEHNNKPFFCVDYNLTTTEETYEKAILKLAEKIFCIVEDIKISDFFNEEEFENEFDINIHIEEVLIGDEKFYLLKDTPEEAKEFVEYYDKESLNRELSDIRNIDTEFLNDNIFKLSYYEENKDIEENNMKGVYCHKCNEIIYSRSKHDYRTCSCGNVSIDDKGNRIVFDRASEMTVVNIDKNVLLEQILNYDYVFGTKSSSEGLLGKFKIVKSSNRKFYEKLIGKKDIKKIFELLI